MIEDVRRVLQADERIGYALVFGSSVRRPEGSARDLDVAVGLRQGVSLAVRELGELAARLEAVAGRPVDLVLMDEAPPALAYRVFRGGVVVADRDHSALVERKTRAILEYLDFRPVEDLCARGVLSAATRGR